MKAFTLHSHDLRSKFGFSDGDLFDDFMYDEFGEDAAAWPCTSHELLIAVVRQGLLPALGRPVEVYEISSIHNPIRAEDHEHAALSDVTVTLDKAGAKAIAESLRKPKALS